MKIHNIPKVSDEPCVDIVLDTIRQGKQALVFVGTKRGAEKLAEDISSKIKTINDAQTTTAENALHALPSPTKQCKRLALCLKKGIAFHHSGLHYAQREIVETAFKGGIVKIICATPTLAAGVDLPAFRAIIRDLKRYGGRWGMDWIPTLEYMQMAGRAGRPSYDSFGEAIIIAANSKEKEILEEKYIYGEPEEIYSKLAVEPVLRTYVLSLISSEFIKNKKELLGFFEKTFWAHQYKDMVHLERIIDKMLNLLESFEFIEYSHNDFVSAHKFEEDTTKIKATLMGKRIAQLYLDPLTAYHLISGLKRSGTKMLTPIGLLHLACHTLEMRPLNKVKNKELEVMYEKLAQCSGDLLEPEPTLYDPAYGDYLDALKTATILEEWMDERGEEFLLEKYDIRPGELHAKLERADWLFYALEEIARLLKMHSLLKEITKVRLRLSDGVREELLPLMKLKNVGKIRARKLFGNKIKSIEDVKEVEYTTLVQLLGKGIALDIKKQVGQDLSKVPVKENKRKGQISLLDY